MGLVARMATYWHCDECGAEWFADSENGPRQCRKCGSRKWNDGMVRDANRYLSSLVVRHLNPYRRPLSVRQKAGLMGIAANRRAESARKAIQSSLEPLPKAALREAQGRAVAPEALHTRCVH